MKTSPFLLPPGQKMLYLISTPIGNLQDITYRAVRVLQEADTILCEDTRTTRILTQHYDIKTPLISFHKFSEKKQEMEILNALENGKNIALVSDAGTPILCDPGLSLVQECYQRQIPLQILPGASSIIQGLVGSGFSPFPFQFIGFLPKKNQERLHALKKVLCYLGTTVSFETPHRIEETLQMLHELAPERRLSIGREMTKKFEEHLLGTASSLLEHFSKHPPKGEMVLVIEQGASEAIDLSLEEILELLTQSHGLSPKEALAEAAKLLKTPKKNLYRMVHHSEE